MNPALHSADLAASMLRCEGIPVDERLVLQAAMTYAVETPNNSNDPLALRREGVDRPLGKDRGGADGTK